MNDADDILRELEFLRVESERLRHQSAAAQEELLELLGAPELGSVTARFDAGGLLAAVEFSAAAQGLEPERLLRDINIAVSIAGEDASADLAPDPNAEFMPEMWSAGGEDAIDAAFSALVDEMIPNVETFTDDFGQLRVSARWGTIMSIDAPERWLATTPHPVIGDEVVRMGRRAALATDHLGRLRDGGAA